MTALILPFASSFFSSIAALSSIYHGAFYYRDLNNCMEPSQIKDDGLIWGAFCMPPNLFTNSLFTFGAAMIANQADGLQLSPPCFDLEFFQRLSPSSTQINTPEPESMRMYKAGLGSYRDADEKRLKVVWDWAVETLMQELDVQIEPNK